jgi:hypothetical protein
LAAAVGVPVTLASATDMARLFREHADGWRAFYRQYAGTPGLVELGRVRYAAARRPWWSAGRAASTACTRGG